MKTRTMMAVLASCAVCGAEAKTAAEEIKGLKDVIASNTVTRVTGYGNSRYIHDWYYGLCTPEEREAIFDRNVSAHRRWIELEPSNPVPQAGLGCAFAAAERYAEAKPELEKALSMGGKLSAMQRAEAEWALANCLWTEGDRDGAMKHVDEVAALYGTGKVSDFLNISGRAKYVSALYHDPDGDIDILRLPHSVDGRPFPTPQEAEYGEDAVSLARVDLELEGLDIDHPAARLLRRKLERFGCVVRGVKDGARNEGATRVRLVLAFDAPVDKPQGYSLDVANGSVRVSARTRLGLTWGVVSLLQCVDRGDGRDAAQGAKPSIKVCSIRDWPKLERRGIMMYWRPDQVEYALFNKLSCNTYIMDLEYVLSPVDRERYRLFARRMREFGIQCYFAPRNIMIHPTVAFTERRNRDNFVERAKFFASIGAGNSVQLDDYRFLPEFNPVDKARVGTAAKLDAKLMTEIYRETKADYPDHFMQFCPPFYFGPDGGLTPGWYPEPRDPYLRSVGKDLDPEIDVYWTGPRVKTHRITPEKAKWYSDLTGRKPTMYWNGDGIANHDFVSFRYPSDPVGFKADNCTNVFDLVAGIQQKMSHPYEASKTGGMADWCWNPDAHDPDIAVRRAIDQMEGPEMYELAVAIKEALEPLNKYWTDRVRVELFEDDPDVLDKCVADASALWEKAKKAGKNGGLFVETLGLSVRWKRRLANFRRNPPDWLKKEYEAVKANTAIAQKECGYDEANGDKFVPAELMQGAAFFKGVGDANGTKRGVRLMTPGDSASGKFPCDMFPPERPPVLAVGGMRFLDLWEKPPKVPAPEVTVEMNGQEVWKGRMFETDVYQVKEIKIPVVAVRRQNEFSIKFTGPKVADQGRIAISYAVVKW